MRGVSRYTKPPAMQIAHRCMSAYVPGGIEKSALQLQAELGYLRFQREQRRVGASGLSISSIRPLSVAPPTGLSASSIQLMQRHSDNSTSFNRSMQHDFGHGARQSSSSSPLKVDTYVPSRSAPGSPGRLTASDLGKSGANDWHDTKPSRGTPSASLADRSRIRNPKQSEAQVRSPQRQSVRSRMKVGAESHTNSEPSFGSTGI